MSDDHAFLHADRLEDGDFGWDALIRSEHTPSGAKVMPSPPSTECDFCHKQFRPYPFDPQKLDQYCDCLPF